MQIRAQIDRMVNSGSIKAIASVALDEFFVIKNLRVVDGKKGLFVACPQESYTKNGEKKYSNIFFPTTNAAKEELEKAVLSAYEQQLTQQQGKAQGYAQLGGHDSSNIPAYCADQQASYGQNWEPSYDDSELPFGMNM